MSTKRKAALAASNTVEEEVHTPPSKRRKLPDVNAESAANTTKVGRELLAQLKRSLDKHGWQIASHFLELPDKNEIPEYYEEIKLPIALDTIEAKLESKDYATISALEGDLKRMVLNAKQFNEKTSQIFADAEKIRKLVSNFMTEKNPAYKTPGYQAVATPIPENRTTRASKENVGDAKAAQQADETRRRTRKGRSSGEAPIDGSQEPEPEATPDAEGPGETEKSLLSFEGRSFQEAQEQIITEMMELTDDDDSLVAANFINLPPRSLTDYYRLIKHPVSLKGIQKLVKGQKGHAPPTNQTLLPSWAAFEQEVNYIWINAHEYNEDGSEIAELASKLETFFQQRLKKAKAVVNGPPQRVKLKLGGKSPEPPPKITLKFGNAKAANAVSGHVNGEEPKRHQDQARASVNDDKSPERNASEAAPAASKDAAPEPGKRPESIKREISQAQTPPLSDAPANGRAKPHEPTPAPADTTMADAAQEPPLSSVNGHVETGAANTTIAAPASSGATHSSAAAAVSTSFNSVMRPQGRDASDALLVDVNISTHPDVTLPQQFNLDIRASDTKAQQSYTLVLPNNQAYLRVKPVLAPSLMQRPSKTLVTFNQRRPNPIAQREPDPLHPIYDLALTAGMNTFEVEIIAGSARGAPKVGSGPDVDIEKVTLFLHLQAA